MPFETTKSAGDDIESNCLKCKCVTNHTIIAMTGKTIAKVQCNSCAARHNYRQPVSERKRVTTTLRRRNGTVVSGRKASTGKIAPGVTKKATGKTVTFETLLCGRSTTSAIPYAINATLTTNDLLSHSLFGLGVVKETIMPNKAEVIFQKYGSKLLICIAG